MKRTLIATLLASGALVSAQSFAAAYGDENDTSWLPKANAAQTAEKQTPSRFAKSGEQPDTHNGVRLNDENNTAWLTGAKR
jgi:hypothetical protein